MSWRRKKDDEYRKWKEMFPWLPFDLFESSGFFNEDFMDQIMGELEKMMEGFDLNDPEAFRKKMGPLTWGWNITMGPDGKPVIKEFGNIKPSMKGAPVASKDREPLVDVFIEDKLVRLIVELPGVSKDDIKVKTTETRISIDAQSGDRKYSCERDLSVKIKPKTASAKYRNGILEFTVERKEPVATEEGFEVKIE
ncbi:MAG TPA: archaeal heat shock protein Hsp20 [candidate division Zixibacteria bacterium]|nr:archaeal heat shock protein Hsp20 [candidate division Zixibacteria bacterium]